MLKPRIAAVSSLLTSLLVVIALGLSSSILAASPDISAIRGIADLRTWDKNQPVRLSGEYEFYWRQHLSPQALLLNTALEPDYQTVPGTWDESGTYPGEGHATFRLNVLLPNIDEYALKLPDIGTAYRLYIDGNLAASAGNAGENAATTIPGYAPTTVRFIPQTERVELIFHISNYDYRIGGIWLPVIFGTAKQIENLAERQGALDMLLFGAIVIIGLYNLGLFALRREDPSSLYLGLFCLLLALRLTTVGERYMTRVVDLPFDTFVKLEYLSWMLAIAAFAGFLHAVVPKEFNKTAGIVMSACMAIGSTIVLFTDVSVYSHIVPVFQVVTIVCMIAGSVAFALAIIRRREGAIILTLAYAVLFYAVANDILVNAGIIDTVLLLNIGLLVFIFFQSMLISYRFTNSFKLIESQRASLAATNLKLQTQEKLRRMAEVETQDLHRQIPMSIKMAMIEQLTDGLPAQLRQATSESRQASEQLILKDLMLLTGKSDQAKTTTHVAAVLQDIAKTDKTITLEPVSGIEKDQRLTADPVYLERMIGAVCEYLLHTGASHINLDLLRDTTEAKSLFYGDLNANTYLVIGISADGLKDIGPESLEYMFSVENTLAQSSRTNSGLGLSVAWNTVHEMGGSIDAALEGTETLRIEFYLPITA